MRLQVKLLACLVLAALLLSTAVHGASSVTSSGDHDHLQHHQLAKRGTAPTDPVVVTQADSPVERRSSNDDRRALDKRSVLQPEQGTVVQRDAAVSTTEDARDQGATPRLAKRGNGMLPHVELITNQISAAVKNLDPDVADKVNVNVNLNLNPLHPRPMIVHGPHVHLPPPHVAMGLPHSGALPLPGPGVSHVSPHDAFHPPNYGGPRPHSYGGPHPADYSGSHHPAYRASHPPPALPPTRDLPVAYQTIPAARSRSPESLSDHSITSTQYGPSKPTKAKTLFGLLPGGGNKGESSAKSRHSKSSSRSAGSSASVASSYRSVLQPNGAAEAERSSRSSRQGGAAPSLFWDGSERSERSLGRGVERPAEYVGVPGEGGSERGSSRRSGSHRSERSLRPGVERPAEAPSLFSGGSHRSHGSLGPGVERPAEYNGAPGQGGRPQLAALPWHGDGSERGSTRSGSHRSERSSRRDREPPTGSQPLMLPWKDEVPSEYGTVKSSFSKSRGSKHGSVDDLSDYHSAKNSFGRSGGSKQGSVAGDSEYYSTKGSFGKSRGSKQGSVAGDSDYHSALNESLKSGRSRRSDKAPM